MKKVVREVVKMVEVKEAVTFVELTQEEAEIIFTVIGHTSHNSRRKEDGLTEVQSTWVGKLFDQADDMGLLIRNR